MYLYNLTCIKWLNSVDQKFGLKKIKTKNFKPKIGLKILDLKNNNNNNNNKIDQKILDLKNVNSKKKLEQKILNKKIEMKNLKPPQKI